MSEEHLWPEWLSKIIPKTENKHSSFKISTKFDPANNTAFVTPSVNERQGDVASKKLKVVCRKCNNGWMSKIESDAQNIMKPLVLGERFNLNLESSHPGSVNPSPLGD